MMVQRYDNPPKLLLHNFRGILPNSEKTITLASRTKNRNIANDD